MSPKDGLLSVFSSAGLRKLAVLAHLVFNQLLGMLEFLDALKGRPAFRLLSQAPVDLTQAVVVLGRRWIETDRVAQCLRRAVPLSLGLVCPRHLVVTQVTLGVQRDRLSGIFKRRVRLIETIVTFAHVDLGG